MSIIAGAMIDTLLESAIRCRLRVCEETNVIMSWNGGLGTTGSPGIRFAYTIGMIGRELYEELIRINDIRIQNATMRDSRDKSSHISTKSEGSIKAYDNLLRIGGLSSFARIQPPLIILFIAIRSMSSPSTGEVLHAT